MKIAIVYFSLIATLIALSACATTSTSNGKSTYSMVDVATAKTLHDRDALFVDVRNKGSFDQGHIPGAVNIEINKFNDNTLAKVGKKDQEIVFYCFGTYCNASNKASSLARAWGYQKVYYFMKGFPGWWNAGYPIEQ